ncbi:MAG: hypothetical protein COU51_00300 [Parcubacteria group bacterium CG10_big_fil_rev_8_21_14_0_10_36_14]|nr:MAG: hypothetical protein COU51_00300 [Parcubacteria group bacterium CG10_big_fil_rev_8_21_14_0_10_36_14]
MACRQAGRFKSAQPDQLKLFSNSEAFVCSLAPPEFIPHGEARPAEGGASEQTLSPENLKCLTWSQLLNEARTFFERNSD